MNKKNKTLLAIAFIAGITITGLYGIDFSKGYLMVSELLSNPQAHMGQKIDAMGVIEPGTLKLSPELIAFDLRDDADGNSSIHVEYVGDMPPNLEEGKKVSISGVMVSSDKIQANKIVMGCPSKYKE